MADEATPPPIPSQSPPTTTAPPTTPIAIWSLVLSLFFFVGGCLFTAIPAVICGHAAWSKIRKSNGALRGKRIATAGLIVGYIGIVLGFLGIPLMVGMVKSDRERIRQLATEQKEITSDDGKLKVTTSGFWVKRSDLNKKSVVAGRLQR
jgi:hypothetical protein